MVFGGKKEADMRPSNKWQVSITGGPLQRMFIRSCPRCGRTRYIQIYPYYGHSVGSGYDCYTWLYTVQCGGCGFMGASQGIEASTTQEAVSKWNKLKRKGGSK